MENYGSGKVVNVRWFLQWSKNVPYVVNFNG